MLLLFNEYKSQKDKANAQSFAFVWEFEKRQVRYKSRIKIQKMRIDYVVHL